MPNPTQTDRAPLQSIEFNDVDDDPRSWSPLRKNLTLATISAAAMIATLGFNIYNPAINQIQQDLHGSSQELALSLSLYIAVQGTSPLLWSALSEIRGRRIVYLASISLFVVGAVVGAISTSIGLLIGMRCIQAIGGAAVISIGAATLADIFDPHERGTMMGIFWAAPVLGPALGPIFGGILTQVFNWRATFWFLAIFGAVCFISFIPLKDTFRQERSLAYQAALKKSHLRSSVLSSTGGIHLEKARVLSEPALKDEELALPNPGGDVPIGPSPIEVTLSLTDVNPLPPIKSILRRINNIVILSANALLFALEYVISYTVSRTLSSLYKYGPLDIGIVLLSFGIGCVIGSVLGGRWSDKVYARLRAHSNGLDYPEMRLKSTVYAMPLLPMTLIALGWLSQRKDDIATICVALFLIGFFSIWIYCSSLAYLVDANAGRSSSAVATNSAIRGLTAFVASEVAAPLQDAIGNGWFFTLWAGLIVVANLLILLLIRYGRDWRLAADRDD